jgi:hypothetical protein
MLKRVQHDKMTVCIRPLAAVQNRCEVIVMTNMATEIIGEPHMLKVGDRPAKRIATVAELTDEFVHFDRLHDGQSVLLQRTPKHYIKAVRRKAFWSASYRNGPLWTVNGFSPEGTSEYSDRKVKESRVAGTLRNRIRVAIASPSPANALTTSQVEGLFEAFFCGTKFPIAPGIGTG